MAKKNAKSTAKPVTATVEQPMEQPAAQVADQPVAEMKYTAMVTAGQAELEKAGTIKAALDVARLLDDPMFALPEKHERYGVSDARERAFDALCALFVRAGLTPPPLEIGLVRAFLPTPPKEPDEKFAAKAVDHVKRVCATRLKDASEILPLAKALGAFECTSRWSNVDAKGLVCLINSRLLALGLEPLVPDYASLGLETACDEAVPARNVRVVAVDDELESLLKTALALIGWPRVETVLYRYPRPTGDQPRTPESKQADLKRTAEAVAALKPDVVLMDEGLCGPFEGHELVPAIRELLPDVRFVANTGGSPDMLNEVGARGNCEKGRTLRDVCAAVISCR